ATEEEKTGEIRDTGLLHLSTFRLNEAGWTEHFFRANGRENRRAETGGRVIAGACGRARFARARGRDVPEVPEVVRLYVRRDAETGPQLSPPGQGKCAPRSSQRVRTPRFA